MIIPLLEDTTPEVSNIWQKISNHLETELRMSILTLSEPLFRTIYYDVHENRYDSTKYL